MIILIVMISIINLHNQDVKKLIDTSYWLVVKLYTSQSHVTTSSVMVELSSNDTRLLSSDPSNRRGELECVELTIQSNRDCDHIAERIPFHISDGWLGVNEENDEILYDMKV